MKICNVVGCGKIHDSRGYCKNHYRSFTKYGNPMQIETNKALRAYDRIHNPPPRRTGRNFSTDGTCRVKNCKSPIKARLLCDKHYARKARTGTTDIQNKLLKVKPKTCMALGCEKEHYGGGFCSTHKSNNQKLGTPYLKRTKHFCGVSGCDEIHWGKGMCKVHFQEWDRFLRNVQWDV